MSASLWSVYYDQPRLDLKCGKGSISPGERCTKGRATEGDRNPISIRSHALTGAKWGAGIGATVGGLSGAALGAVMPTSGGVGGRLANAAIQGLSGAVGGAIGGAVQGGVIGTGVGAVRKIGRHRERLREIEAPIVTRHKKRYARLKASGASRQQLSELDKKTSSELASAYDKGNLNGWSRRDSPWALGFVPT